MATQFTQQAEAQLNPLYDQQQSALQAQIPSIQNLYSTLTQGLQSNYNTNLATGVQNINEDASARGVLRSTLPNDARTTLTAQLGSALQQSLGELGAKQASDIAAVNSQIGNLGLQRVQSINDLAKALQSSDLQERQFALDQLTANRNYQLEQAKLAASTSGSSLTAAEQKILLQEQLAQDITNAFNGSGAKDKNYTERTVLPALYSAYAALGNDTINKMVYQYRKNALGY